MKKLIHMVIYMLFVLNGLADGWNTDAWPSTNHFRFTSTNDYVNKINLYAKKWSRTMSVTCTHYGTNGNDAIYNWDADGYIYSAKDTPNAATKWIWQRQEYSGWDWMKIGNINYWDYNPPMWQSVGVQSGTASNHFEKTSTYLSDIREDYTNYVSFADTNILTNTYWVFQYPTKTGWSNKIVEIDSQIAVGVKTNMTLNVKDLRCWDAYMALKERECFDTWYHSLGSPKFYRDERNNLVGFKHFLKSSYTPGNPYWPDPYLTTIVDYRKATNDSFDTYFSTPDTNGNYPTSFPMLSQTGILSLVGAPTNYFDYTPYRQLNGAGLGIGHIVTSKFTIVTSGTGTVDRNVWDYDGNYHAITGTNGQEFSVVVTNDNVLEGFTTLDYGWKYFNSFVDHLIWTKRSPGIGEGSFTSLGVTNWYSYWDMFCDTWAEAVGGATNLSPEIDTDHPQDYDWEAFPCAFCVGYEHSGSYDISCNKIWAYYVASLSTNFPTCDLDLYIQVQTNTFTGQFVPFPLWFVGGDDVLTHDANDCNVTNYPIFRRNVSTNIPTGRTNANVYVLVGPDKDTMTDVPNMCDEPSEGKRKTKGWTLGIEYTAGKIGQLFKWDVANGLKYK